ncbi:hypothetical protein LINPERHAP2_LOCUS35436, partial [Linum perenne]
MIKLRLRTIKLRFMNKNTSHVWLVSRSFTYQVGLPMLLLYYHVMYMYSCFNLTLGGEGSCSRYTSDGSWVLIAPIDSLRTCPYR